MIENPRLDCRRLKHVTLTGTPPHVRWREGLAGEGFGVFQMVALVWMRAESSKPLVPSLWLQRGMLDL